MVEIADRDLGAGSQVVVNVVIEKAEGATVGMALKVASNPVKSIAKALGKEGAAGS